MQKFSVLVPKNDSKILSNVKASSVKRINRSKTISKHYTKYKSAADIMEINGLAILENSDVALVGKIAEHTLNAEIY